MQFFDANAQIGRHMALTPGMPFTGADLLRDMDRLGIAEALVLDSLSREVHPAGGNRRILRLTWNQPRLHACWSLLPPRGGESGPLDALPTRMRDGDVRAVKLLPGHHHFSLRQWCLGGLLDVLEACRLVTFIDYNPTFLGGRPPDDTDWDEVVALCGAHPKLPVVISENRIRSANRMIYQALEACPNLHIELSGFWVHHGIEFICREFGAERLLFGTKWPARDVGGPITQLRLADIDPHDKAQIAGDNLRAMLDRAHPRKPTAKRRPKVTVRPPRGSSLRARALRAEPPVGEVIIDAHAHLGKTCFYHLADSSPEAVAGEMQRLGVWCSIVFGYSGVTGDCTADNDLIAHAIKMHPKRYHGLILVNPLHPEEMRAELARCESRGFIGVKLIPAYQGYPEDGPNIEIPVAWANERGMIVLNHGWGPADHLRRLAEKHPRVTFIVGHYTTAHARVVNSYPNVYQCTCEPLGYNSMEILTDAIDPAKILFGSDMTDLPLPMGMGPILHARIPEDDKKAILGLNALRILEAVTAQV